MRNSSVNGTVTQLETSNSMDEIPSRRNLDFFKGISQVNLTIGKYDVKVPLFYYDLSAIMVTFVTPIERIRKLLPSAAMYPLRLTPWHGLTIITAFEYRDTDIGPYNELSVSFPVTLHKPAPILTGVLKAMNEGLMTYTWKLPVTTEVARYLGVEHAGYPKFLAEITFDRHAGWVTCTLAEAGSHILTLRMREITLNKADRMRYEVLNIHDGCILRGMASVSLPHVGQSRRPSDISLELGSHSMGQELHSLGLGRMIDCRYCNDAQLILHSVLESYPMS